MNREQRRRRIVLGALSAALAVQVVVGAPDASAVDKTRYPGYNGPDLEANCDALDEWEIDTAGYPECGPGGGGDSEECDAFNAEGCEYYLPPEWQVAGR